MKSFDNIKIGDIATTCSGEELEILHIINWEEFSNPEFSDYEDQIFELNCLMDDIGEEYTEDTFEGAVIVNDGDETLLYVYGDEGAYVINSWDE